MPLDSTSAEAKALLTPIPPSTYERLTQLLRVVEAAPPEKLNMRTWQREDPICGTVCCAAGWAAHDPWFAGIGLVMKTEGGIPTLSHLNLDKIFGITYAEAEYIFTPKDRECYLINLPKSQVIKRIYSICSHYTP